MRRTINRRRGRIFLEAEHDIIEKISLNNLEHATHSSTLLQPAKHTYIIGYTFYSKLLCTMDDDGPSNNERGRFCRTRITHLTSLTICMIMMQRCFMHLRRRNSSMPLNNQLSINYFHIFYQKLHSDKLIAIPRISIGKVMTCYSVP